MIKNIFFVLVLLVSAYSCGNIGGKAGIEAKGGKMYGGCLNYSENDVYSSLYPLEATDVFSSNLVAQIYEGLVKFNSKNLDIIPGVAEKWTVNPEKTEYIFTIKKGVTFHDDACFDGGKGREVKAQDFKYSFNLLCTKSPDNILYNSTFKDRVVGANDFYDKKATDLAGVKVIDDYTLKITLAKPSLSFLSILATGACVAMPKEGVEKYKNKLAVGCGPFKFSSTSNNDKILLLKNESYHGMDSSGNKLPFLDSIQISILSTKSAELEMFMNNKLDIISSVPSESVNDILEKQIADFQNKPAKFLLVRAPDLATQCYGFNITDGVFKDKRIRQAFNYALNREKIVKDVLNDQANAPGVYGIVPPSLKGYNASLSKGYTYDPEKARKLLTEAGYPNGKGFPIIKMELNSGGARNSNIAFELQSQLLKELNVNVNLEVVPMNKLLEDIKLNKAGLFRYAWVADYPSPETFLNMFYGKYVSSDVNLVSFPNAVKYVNKDYDKLFEKAKESGTETESYALYQQAENVMLEDAPILVLYYDEDYKMIQSQVRDFYFNPLRYKDFSKVYLKPVVNSTDKKADSTAK